MYDLLDYLQLHALAPYLLLDYPPYLLLDYPPYLLLDYPPYLCLDCLHNSSLRSVAALQQSDYPLPLHNLRSLSERLKTKSSIITDLNYIALLKVITFTLQYIDSNINIEANKSSDK